MKRFFHFFAACALLLTFGVSSISAQAQAETVAKRVKIGKLYYNLYYDETAEVTHRNMYVSEDNYEDLKEVSIPSSVTYTKDGKTYAVTSIGSSAFGYAKNLEKVTVPSTVTSIGSGAFEKSGLQSISIPTGSVTRIGYGVFKDTPLHDNSSNWYEGVLSVGNYLIEVKNSVKKLTVKEGTRLLADNCCKDKTSLEYVSLPNSVEYIGYSAFSGCTKLETVIMSNNVKVISGGAFEQCKKLKSIDLPNTCESIGSSAFEGCSSLTEITLPENPECVMIYGKTFGDCTNLKKVVLPKQITNIGSQAFLNCNSLKYIYCNGKPKQIYEFTFDYVDTENITVYFPERHKAFYEEKWKGFNLVPLRFTEGGIYYELNDTKKTAVVVPERDDADNYKSLSGAILIDKIVIADGEKFTINGMAQGAFKFSKIGRITIDAAMNEIPEEACMSCANLTDAILPKSVTSIGDRAFSGCSSLELVPGLTNDQKDYLPNVDKIGESAFFGCVKLPKLRLLTETEIGEWAFSGCKGVKDIVLGADVKTIGANAFSECSGLESLTIYSTTQLPFTANMITGVDKGNFVVYVQAKDVAKYKAADGWKEFTIKPIGGEKQYTVIVDVNDSEGGTVTGSGTYYEGETYTLTAIPNEGWHFVRWGNGSTINPATGTISNDVRTTAFFGPDAKFYDLHVVSADETMGTVSGGGEHIEENTVRDISATPKEGCEFLYWVDSKGVYWGKQTEWKVTQDETLTAHFRVIPDYDEYMVFVLGERVTSANAGDILGDGVWSYDRETHTLRTMKDATYKKENKEFIQDWETGLGALTVVVNHHITAEVETTDKVIRFALYGYNGIKFVGSKFSSVNLTALNMIAAQTHKTLEVSNHLRLFITQGNTTDFGKSQFSTSMIFSGTPAIRVNSASLRLSVNLGNKISNQTNDKIELTNAEINYGELNGQYMEILDLTPMYMVNYQTEAAMNLCLVSGMGSFYEGEQVTLYPHPEEGYEFVKWSNGVTDNPYTFTMPAEDVLIDPMVQGKDITPDGAFVNAYAPVGQGTIKDFEGGWYAAGTELSIYVEPFNDWHFVHWDDGNTDNPRIFTVEAGKSMSITAEFEQTPRYTVTFLDWDDEVLKQEKVKEGEDATAPEDPYREGYTFMGWKPADFTDIHSNLTVHAQYEKEEFVFECGDHLLGVLTDHVLTITGYGDMWDWDFNTPWFNGKNKITSVQLPDGLTSIGNYAFDGCESLTSIDIPAGVTNIGFAAFSKCYSLTSIDIPAGVTDIKKSTFYLCYNLTSVNLPAGVTDIGNTAFYGCNRLTSINIPEGVTGIGNSAFHSCTGLTSIDIPASVTGIGDYAFSYCLSLNSVTCHAAEPPVLGEYIFEYVDCSKIPLYVPRASLDKYKSAEQWKEFNPIESYEFAVTFLDKDGNLIEEQYVVKGEGAVAPEAPEVEGYTFTGWDKEFDNVTSDLTVKALYDINIYTVTFIFIGLDDIGIELKVENVEYGGSATPPDAPEVEGYYFVGWDKEFDNVTSDLTVSPVYNINIYTVTFLGFNDTELKVEYVEYGYSATPPDAPEVEGYTFTGWDKEFDNVTSDLTVKAKYEINHYALTLVAGHGTIAITDESGEHSLNPDMVMHGTIVKLIVTADDGYLFKGWSDSNTDNPRYVTVTEDKTFTALFEKEPDDPTGVEEVESQKSKVESTKLLRDGMLYILREGKMYNAQGQKVQ